MDAANAVAGLGKQYSNEAERKIHWSFTVDDARRVIQRALPCKFRNLVY